MFKTINRHFYENKIIVSVAYRTSLAIMRSTSIILIEQSAEPVANKVPKQNCRKAKL